MLKLPTVFFLISFLILAVIHIIALQLSLYWAFSWFDIPMHFFGGAVVALGIFTLNDLRIVVPDRWLYTIPVVLLVILVAMVWEVYELLIGIPIEANYVVDTVVDLVLGALGGLVGYSIGTSIKKL
ncbi:MAG: hypothetical protein ACI9H6_000542 [Patiriisocius sp.]|jgi:hypothetical protein